MFIYLELIVGLILFACGLISSLLILFVYTSLALSLFPLLTGVPLLYFQLLFSLPIKVAFPLCVRDMYREKR